MFEGRSQSPISNSQFLARLALSAAAAAAVIAAALAIGVLGYHCIAALPWIDALLDAAMILGGMGPVNKLESDAAKLFAAGYALFSGLVFISVMALTLAPVMHWVLHKFHIDETDLKR